MDFNFNCILICFNACLVMAYVLVLVFVIQVEPYILGIMPGCAASESSVTSPELLIMFPYGYLERF